MTYFPIMIYLFPVPADAYCIATLHSGVYKILYPCRSYGGYKYTIQLISMILSVKKHVH